MMVYFISEVGLVVMRLTYSGWPNIISERHSEWMVEPTAYQKKYCTIAIQLRDQNRVHVTWTIKRVPACEDKKKYIEAKLNQKSIEVLD